MTPAFTLDHLLDLLVLKEVGSGKRETVLEGSPQEIPPHRVFGGLLLAQAVMAAGATVGSDLQPLSLQADFARPVPTSRPIAYTVQHVVDGAAMASRRVLVSADGDELFSAVVRLGSTRDDLPSYTTLGPADVPPPESLADLHERFGGVAEVPTWWSMSRPVEFRHVLDPAYVEPAPERGDRQTAWLRARGEMPPDPLLHAALIAYASDMSIMEAAFRALGGTRHGPGSRLLTVGHNLWFHRPTRADRWHQFDQRAPVMSHGRAVGHAEVFDPDGLLVASASQFALIKSPDAVVETGIEPTTAFEEARDA